jgi:hypothetical protein
VILGVAITKLPEIKIRRNDLNNPPGNRFIHQALAKLAAPLRVRQGI